MGAVAGRVLAVVDAALPQMSDAMAARYGIPAREALALLRAVWRDICARQARIEADAAAALPMLEEEGEDGAQP
jgi:hypothetical protein